MSQNLVIIGAGFAGVWSALAAKRLAALTKNPNQLQVLVVAPEPHLVIRPRLYESQPSNMTHDLESLFEAAGVQYLRGAVESIETEAKTVTARSADGGKSTVHYDRLILAAGSSVVCPKGIPGIEQHAFNVDSLAAAVKLESHLESLATLPQDADRDTIVVCGAGFTGIELATELPKRLGHLTNPRIVLVENADVVGPELGPGLLPTITQALKDLEIEVRVASSVAEISSDAVILASGERIHTKTAIWTAGVRATPLTQQIPGDQDRLSRLHVDQHLRVPQTPTVFATGDAARALANKESSRYALMSCQHALQLGRVSGHNAAADLLGEPLVEYAQPSYNCCLDLGAWGAVIGGGWERDVKLTGDLAKKVKAYINQKLIYPPGDVEEALAMAGPVGPDSDELFENMVKAVA